MSIIELKNVSKIYKVKSIENNKNIIKSILRPNYKYVKAVDNISLAVEPGEIVGYIGPNGAGKSTTLKMLSGILTPTEGEVWVNKINPSKNRKENAKQIGVVFGQRSQLLWDLPVIETFNLYQKMYEIPMRRYKENMLNMDELFGLKEFIDRPARQLSLGQKMKANIALALVHDPSIVFLDEPTIGLDVVAKDNVRNFLKEINRKMGITVLLTTHDLSDIEQICTKIVMIDKGKLIYNGDKNEFINTYSTNYKVKVVFDDKYTEINDNRLKKIMEEGRTKIYTVKKDDLSNVQALSLIVDNYNITDISIQNSSIEDAVKTFYK